MLVYVSRNSSVLAAFPAAGFSKWLFPKRSEVAACSCCYMAVMLLAAVQLLN
jgi:hypothetical protein